MALDMTDFQPCPAVIADARHNGSRLPLSDYHASPAQRVGYRLNASATADGSVLKSGFPSVNASKSGHA